MKKAIRMRIVISKGIVAQLLKRLLIKTQQSNPSHKKTKVHPFLKLANQRKKKNQKSLLIFPSCQSMINFIRFLKHVHRNVVLVQKLSNSAV